MPQLFPAAANSVLKWTLIGVPLGALLLAAGRILWVRSPWVTGEGRNVEQPLQFSHAHHVGGYGIDCRYCHASVERAGFADIPPTETCMSCHSQVWTGAAMLEPVRASLASAKPLRWNRVNQIPDFTYFQHDIHIAKGVACQECHGRVDRMPLMAQARNLRMSFCLDCHRDPAARLRPPAGVFAMQASPGRLDPDSARRMGLELMRFYHVRTAGLTDCVRCHR
jgi:hypothetical protein